MLSGLWRHVLSWLGYLQQQLELQAMTLSIYSALMKVYAFSGLYERACDLYEDIQKDGIEPDSIMHLGGFRESKQVFNCAVCMGFCVWTRFFDKEQTEVWLSYEVCHGVWTYFLAEWFGSQSITTITTGHSALHDHDSCCWKRTSCGSSVCNLWAAEKNNISWHRSLQLSAGCLLPSWWYDKGQRVDRGDAADRHGGQYHIQHPIQGSSWCWRHESRQKAPARDDWSRCSSQWCVPQLFNQCCSEGRQPFGSLGIGACHGIAWNCSRSLHGLHDDEDTEERHATWTRAKVLRPPWSFWRRASDRTKMAGVVE